MEILAGLNTCIDCSACFFYFGLYFSVFILSIPPKDKCNAAYFMGINMFRALSESFQPLPHNLG